MRSLTCHPIQRVNPETAYAQTTKMNSAGHVYIFVCIYIYTYSYIYAHTCNNSNWEIGFQFESGEVDMEGCGRLGLVRA